MLDNQSQVLARGEGLEAKDVNPIGGANLVVVFRVDEGESKHSLLLQVGLMDTGERASDDGQTTEETRLKGGVLAGRTFTVVVVTDDNPFNAMVTVVGSSGGYRAVFTGDLVLDFVGLTIFLVDSTNQAVL